jgi:hypothetical protein
VQRSASSGLDSLDRASEDRWEVVVAQDQRTPEEFADPPRAPALTNVHSSSGGHPPRPESPYSTASSHNIPYSQPQAQMQTPNPQRKAKKPAPTSAVAALGILNSLSPSAAAGAQGSPPGVPHQQMWVDDTGSEMNVRIQEERREKKPSSWWGDRSKDRDKGKARDVNDPADLVRMIGECFSISFLDHSPSTENVHSLRCYLILISRSRLSRRHSCRRLVFCARSLRTN